MREDLELLIERAESIRSLLRIARECRRVEISEDISKSYIARAKEEARELGAQQFIVVDADVTILGANPGIA